MKVNYSKIQHLICFETCTGITQTRWDKYMKGAVRADKTKIDRLVKKLLPELYEALALDSPNPFNYYKTEKHLILIHSAIEYFLEYSYN